MKNKEKKLTITITTTEGEVLHEVHDVTSAQLSVISDGERENIQSICVGKISEQVHHIAMSFIQQMQFLKQVTESAFKDHGKRAEYLEAMVDEIAAASFGDRAADGVHKVLELYIESRAGSGKGVPSESQLIKIIENLSYFQAAAVAIRELEERYKKELATAKKPLEMKVLGEDGE